MIRAMLLSDAAPVSALIREAFASIAPPLDPPPSALNETADSVAHQIATGGGAVWDAAGLNGCVLWREQDGGLYVGRLAARPAASGRGIARHLLAEAENEARRRRLPRLLLAVRLALPRNRRMFAAAGFTETALRCHPGYGAPTYAEAEKRL